MIRGHGSHQPKCFFISDSPIGDDLKSEYALSGWQGNLLKSYCQEAGLRIDENYRTCLIKEETPKVDDKDLTATKALLETYGPILKDEIETLQPNLLIPLGELSFRYLTGLENASIRKFRGSVLAPETSLQLARPNLKILPILGPHPYLNAEYKMRAISRIDFQKIPRYLNDSPIPDNFYNIWVCRSSTALRAFFERSYSKVMKDPQGFVVFDIETFMQIPICISFCFDGQESVCIPLLDNSVEFDQRVLMLELVARLLASPIPKVNQNIKYDHKILERWDFRVRKVVGDTMLAASSLYCEFPKNLGFLTSIYTDLPYFKDEGKSFDPDRSRRDRYYQYNAKDSLATHQIYEKQREEIKEQGVQFVYDNLITLLPIYKGMENRGLRVSQATKDSLLLKYQSYYHIQELKLKELVGRQYFNPLSPKQCKELIYDELGYEKVQGVKLSKDGTPSTDEESLENLLVKGDPKRSPNFGPYILSTIIGARKIHKVIEILELPLYPDGRFRCEFNLAGTETGRSSAGETTDQLIALDESSHKITITNLGHSLQTIGKHGFAIDGKHYGKDLRSMYVPSPGYIYVECDLSGAEARVDRVLSGNFDLDVFNNPGIHRYTGSLLYNCLPSEIKKGVLVDGVDRYHLSKIFRHAAERNMQAERAAMLTGLKVSECKILLNNLHEKEPQIRNTFHRDVQRAIDQPTHCLIAPNGRRRDFFDRIDKHTYNEGISFLPQAIVSDQTKFSFHKTLAECPWAYLLAEMHDGSLAEVPIGRELEYIGSYKRNIETGIDFRFCTLSRDYELIIPCEGSIGYNWLDMTECK